MNILSKLTAIPASLFQRLRDAVYRPAPDSLSALAAYAELLDTGLVRDKFGNEFVLLSGAGGLSGVEAEIRDKTEFEAVQNHVHVLDNISRSERKCLKQIAHPLCVGIMAALQKKYPGRKFCVYATASDSFILRFHQCWDGEPLYYDPDNSYGGELLCCIFSE